MLTFQTCLTNKVHTSYNDFILVCVIWKLMFAMGTVGYGLKYSITKLNWNNWLNVIVIGRAY